MTTNQDKKVPRSREEIQKSIRAIEGRPNYDSGILEVLLDIRDALTPPTTGEGGKRQTEDIRLDFSLENTDDVTLSTTKGCCSLCLEGNQFHLYCKNPNCQCHKEKEEKIEIVVADRIDYCVDCGKEHGFDCPLTPKSFSDRFDERFTLNGEWFEDADVIVSPREVKSFFINEMEEVVKLVEDLKKKPTSHPIPCPEGKIGCLVYHCETKYSPEDLVFNEAIDKCLSIIKTRMGDN